VTPATTALIAAAPSLPPRDIRLILAEADFQKAFAPSGLLSALGHGRAGSRAIRRAVATHMPQLARTQNDFEAEFLFLLERFRLPLPEINARVGRFRPDMVWRDRRVIVELDGKDAHTRPAQVARDHRRDLSLRAMGFTVVRYTWEQVTLSPEVVAADLRRLLVGP
jgi:very-short-patch-repair endonuclease